MTSTSMSRDHGFHPLRVRRVVPETHDTRSFVFDVPPDLRDAFAYEAGQFCTFRIPLGDDELLRCYSMSSSPDVDDELTLTVKRVAGGRCRTGCSTRSPRATSSRHAPGGGLHPARPPDADRRVRRRQRHHPGDLGDQERAGDDRSHVRLLYANRERESVIFRAALDALVAEHAGRFEVEHHLDADQGFVHSDLVRGSWVTISTPTSTSAARRRSWT